MRFQSSLLVLGLAAASFGVSEAAPVREIVPKGAVSFTSKAQGFAVWLPFKPREGISQGALGFLQMREVPIVGGGTISSFFFVSPTEQFVYAVYVTASPSVVKLKTSDRFDALQSKSNHPKLKWLRREDIQLGEFPGRELKTIYFNNEATFRTRIYLTPKKSYQLLAIGKQPPTAKRTAQITRVFDSFRILPQK